MYQTSLRRPGARAGCSRYERLPDTVYACAASSRVVRPTCAPLPLWPLPSASGDNGVNTPCETQDPREPRFVPLPPATSGGMVSCPGGAHKLSNGQPAIKVLSWKEVRAIAEKFVALNPYEQTAVPGSILKIEDVNFDSIGKQRQLYGYAISAKRYALHERKRSCYRGPKSPRTRISLSTEGQQGRPRLDSRCLGLVTTGTARIGAKSTAMMRIVLSTPHMWQRLNHSTRPYNFLFCPLIDTVAGYPAGVDPNRFTLLTPFSKERKQWLQAECINVFDGKVYHLA